MSTMTTALNVTKTRADFPILQRKTSSGADLIYLDNAASTQHPTSVIDAMSNLYCNSYANVHRGIHTLSEEATAAYEAARKTTTAFINASDAREVIFTAGTTAAINTVAGSWGRTNLKAGDRILLPISEHHANIVPWQQLCERNDISIVWLPINDDFLIDESIVEKELQDPRVKLFAFAAASNTLGTEYPVARWTKLAHANDVKVLVDAAQAVPHCPVDVQAWDADFVVFSGHKACGPTGIGVLYGKEALLEAMPPFLGGGGMIHRVTTEGFETARLPEKFEAGTPPIVEAVGLGAALDYLEDIGLENIHAHERKLCEIAESGLRKIDGLRIIGPTPDQKGGIISFVIEGLHAHDISQSLDLDGIAVRAGHHCTMPLHESLGLTMSCRASFYLFNTVEEAEKLVEAVHATKARFEKRLRRRR